RHLDPHVDIMPSVFEIGLKPGIYCLATRHEVFATIAFPDGSVVIDPFRFVRNQHNIVYHPVGAPKTAIPEAVADSTMPAVVEETPKEPPPQVARSPHVPATVANSPILAVVEE